MRAQSAIAARYPSLPDHGRTPPVKRRAFRFRDVAYGNRGEEIRLALYRGRRLPGLEVGCSRGPAEIVRKGHKCAAMHDSEAIVEILAGNKLGGHALRRYMSDLKAEEFGKGRLYKRRFIHIQVLPDKNQGRGP